MANKQNRPNIFDLNNMIKDYPANHLPDDTDDANGIFSRFGMMDFMMRAEDAPVPDTYACEYYFLRTFPTEDMVEDFPAIASDFLKHEFANLDKYNADDYEIIEDILEMPSDLYTHWILNLMLNAAKSGNGYAVGLFQNLYQTYYRKEYKMLKRFRSISRSELVSIADEDELSDMMMVLPRLLIMCKMYGIKLEKDCSILFILYQDMKEKSEPDWKEFEGFSREIIDSSNDFINAELTKTNLPVYDPKNKALSILHDGERFIREALSWLELPETLIEVSDGELGGYTGWMTRALELMKQINPQKDYSFEEVQHNAVLLHAVCAAASYHDEFIEYTQRILGINKYNYGWEDEQCSFDPSRTRIPSGYKYDLQASVSANTADLATQSDKEAGTQSDKTSLLYEEIEKLRSSLRKEQRENDHLKKQTQQLSQILDEKKIGEEQHAAEHEELMHLRSFVYRMTEEEDEADSSISLQTMEEALQEKKVIIIGGHSNWTYKLRNKFRKWIFLKPEVNNTLDSRILDGADYIYFFTDTISHGTYGKYMKVIRNSKISCYGYIHSINISNNITQIYKDIFGDSPDTK